MVAPVFNKEATISLPWVPMGPHGAPFVFCLRRASQKKFPAGSLGGPLGPLGHGEPWALGTSGPWRESGQLGGPVLIFGSGATGQVAREGSAEEQSPPRGVLACRL